ncbi:hypothetical protein ATK30_0914 [Amycolatopsis echigonensis]|uniref:Uncharacterized protein n=1 Tax=Amycolatopsis echigonensis TaxID=2576905 RepID=A0A2N3X1B2_9PSEU|nr:hypothetical protein [Amycolatopsis niigatensis]PKV99917.1 hypothetical protein ATK30_0914 [Amycolatopsis niigatensis]
MCWNLGNVPVIGGTLAELPWLVDSGSLLLMVELGIAWRAVRFSTRSGRTARLAGSDCRGLLVVLLISIPVGVTPAHLHAPT